MELDYTLDELSKMIDHSLQHRRQNRDDRDHNEQLN